MKKGSRRYSILLPGILFLLLIIDSNSAAQGIAQGITQCLQVIIPSLFPFFFVTGWLNSVLFGIPIPFIHSLSKILTLPKGCESILLTGLLGGYPVGAKAIADACNSKVITTQTAHILLGYCNNAGPAFIFGICHILFSGWWVPWIIWSIQILSAIITGLLLPRPADVSYMNHKTSDISITSVLNRSITVTAIVCGWVLLFKALLQILSQIPVLLSPLPYVAGVLELSNGCLMLADMVPVSLRFCIFCAYLSAGGFCVYLQTASAVGSLGTGLYLIGKCIQTAVCVVLSIPISKILFRRFPLPFNALLPLLGCCIAVIFFLHKKARKRCGNCACDRV